MQMRRGFSSSPVENTDQRISGFTTMRYINLRFTYRGGEVGMSKVYVMQRRQFPGGPCVRTRPVLSPAGSRAP